MTPEGLREQMFVNALQAALPLLDRLAVTQQQQAADVERLREVLRQAVNVLRPQAPGYRFRAALARAGRSPRDLAALTTLEQHRINALWTGAQPSDAEVAELQRIGLVWP
jgi:hypothetical protein